MCRHLRIVRCADWATLAGIAPVIAGIFPIAADEQPSATDAAEPVTFTTREDHQNMLDQLGITKLRPGPSGNESAPNPANYDEAQANPYPELPDPLQGRDGQIVTMAFDTRFAVALVGSSGAGGAKRHRRNFGEAVENLTGSGEYHWMAGKVFRLLGAKDLGASDDYLAAQLPVVNHGLLDGHLAWRQHDGGHTDGPNIEYFVQWVNTLRR